VLARSTRHLPARRPERAARRPRRYGAASMKPWRPVATRFARVSMTMPNEQGSLQIRLLGGLEVVRAAQLVELPRSRKTRALLAYLVAIARPERRDRLCDMFWDGPDDPRAALRWSLTKLRPVLDSQGETRLVADREHVGFEPHGAAVDLHDLRALGLPTGAVSTDALTAVAAQFRGDFLAGLDLPDCYAFSSWLSGERERARTVHVSVLTDLVERLRHVPGEALAFARARVAVDPLADDAYAAVIELLGALGRVREARATYDACCRVLRQELGRAPTARLERARERAEDAARQFGVIESPQPDAALGMNEAPSVRRVRRAVGPIVGRISELQLLASRVRDAAGLTSSPILSGEVDKRTANREPRAAMLLVTGEPGIGKSRLLEELAERTIVAGGVVVQGRAFEAEMVRPYGPWIDALRGAMPAIPRSALSALDDAMRSDLAALVPELANAPDFLRRGNGRDATPTYGAQDRNRLFEAVSGLLDALITAGPPVAIILDDLQWFDDASAALLHFVVRALTVIDEEVPERSSACVVACSARSAELTANGAAAGLVRALRRDGRLHEMHLGPLTRDEVAQLAAGVHAAIDVERVVSASDGNPLFAIEVARSLAIGDTGLPATLDALIADHLARLTPRAREVVLWAAALGGSFDADGLARAGDMAPGDVLAALEELELHEVIRQVPNAAAYDFTHDLVRRVAYGQLSAPRARAVHLAIARRLDERDDPMAALAGDVAHHAMLGQDTELAARAGARAADRCLRLFAFEEARALAARGLEALATPPLIPARQRVAIEADLYRVAVHAGGPRGRASEFQAALERLAEEARTLGMPAQLQNALYLISYIHYHGGEWAEAEQDTLRAVEAGRAADIETAVRALANSGRCLASIERDLPRAQQLLAEARQRCAERGLELVDLAWGAGILAHYTGDLSTASAELQHALDLARREDAHWPACDCLVRLARLELERGAPAMAKRYCEELAPPASKLGDASEEPFGQALAALADMALGIGGEDRLAAAVRALSSLDAKGARAYALIGAAEISLAAGLTDLGAAQAHEALAAAVAVGRRSETALARVLLARVALIRGDDAEAARFLEPVAVEAARPFALNARALRAWQDLTTPAVAGATT
jgi:predicted ATPase/DNA-binding SARP family transcriptional activator